MMIAMQSINELFGPFTISHHMKKKTMSYVFKKCPENHATDKSKHHTQQGIIQPAIAVIKHIYNNRQVHTPDHQWVGFSKHFQEIIPE